MSTTLLLLLLAAAVTAGAGERRLAAPHDFVVCYADDVDLRQVEAYDLAILDPAVALSDQELRGAATELLAYLSVGEVGENRWYREEVRHLVAGENPVWDSWIMDLSDPAWRAFLVERVVPRISARGFSGLFLDTMDAVDELATRQPARAADHRRGLIALVRALRASWPEARIIVNRGFAVIDSLRADIDGLLVESLYQTFDPAAGDYLAVADEESAVLVEQLERQRAAGLDLFVLDYTDQPVVATATAARIRAAGFVPYLSTRALDRVSPVTVAPVPRRALLLYAGDRCIGSAAFDLLAMPLNWLGLAVDYANVDQPLPEGPLGQRYRAVVLAFLAPAVRDPVALVDWVERRLAEGVKLVMVGTSGIGPLAPHVDAVAAERANQRLAGLLGFDRGYGLLLPQSEQTLEFLTPAMMDFEVTLDRPAPSFTELESIDPHNRVHFRVSARGTPVPFDCVVTGPWGGLALEPYIMFKRADGHNIWFLQVFDFLRQALDLQGMPAADVTTLDGSRVLMSHIDGDGFVNRSEIPPHDYSAVVIRDRVLERFRIPITVSIIEGEVGPSGMYPRESAALAAIARSIFALPHIEAASHTYSHPFSWRGGGGPKIYGYEHLAIPGYTMNLEREVRGSVDYIQNLLPPGKQLEMFLWSGNCAPGEEAIRLVDELGIGNLNGGDTIRRRLYPSYTAVAPLVASWGERVQVLAPNQNENVYTGDWIGDKWGFTNVIQTFRATESPRRVKPIDIYYHFYSGENRQSLQAVIDAYDWALGQPVAPIPASQYVRMVKDFRRTRIARLDDGGWRVRNAGSCRTLRFDQPDRRVDLTRSRGVTGFLMHQGSVYVHLDGGGRADIYLEPVTSAPPARLHVARASHQPRRLQIGPDRLRLELGGSGPVACRLAGLPAGGELRVAVDDRWSVATSDTRGELELALPAGQVSRIELLVGGDGAAATRRDDQGERRAD